MCAFSPLPKGTNFTHLEDPDMTILLHVCYSLPDLKRKYPFLTILTTRPENFTQRVKTPEKWMVGRR